MLGSVAGDILRGEAPGPYTRLSFRALAAMTRRCWFEPGEVTEAMAADPPLDLAGDLRVKVKQGLQWLEIGQERTDDEGLGRLPAILLPGLAEFSSLRVDTALYVAITHRDSAALSSSIVFVTMLGELMQAKAPPQPSWWWERYVELAAPLETSKTYTAPDWQGPLARSVQGPLSSLVARLVPEFHGQRRKTRQGRNHVVDTILHVLVLLARHSQSPEEAVRHAVVETSNPVVAALVGTAVGALHGIQRLPVAWSESPVVTRDHGEGKLMSAIGDALDKFCSVP